MRLGYWQNPCGNHRKTIHQEDQTWKDAKILKYKNEIKTRLGDLNESYERFNFVFYCKQTRPYEQPSFLPLGSSYIPKPKSAWGSHWQFMAVGGLEDEWVSGWVGWRVGGWLACDQNDPFIFFYFKIY